MTKNAHYWGKIAKIIRNNEINTMKHSIYKKWIALIVNLSDTNLDLKNFFRKLLKNHVKIKKYLMSKNAHYKGKIAKIIRNN